jgi:hypothetical protein
MKPRVNNEHPDRLSLHAKVGIEAAKKAGMKAYAVGDALNSELKDGTLLDLMLNV